MHQEQRGKDCSTTHRALARPQEGPTRLFRRMLGAGQVHEGDAISTLHMTYILHLCLSPSSFMPHLLSKRGLGVDSVFCQITYIIAIGPLGGEKV